MTGWLTLGIWPGAPRRRKANRGRAAEVSAVSQLHRDAVPHHLPHAPYLLTGDMNEDVNRPPPASGQPIPRLVNDATGLVLTTPVNPFNGDDRTISIQDGLTHRFDYILRCGALASNVMASQVFRTDLLNPTPTVLLPDDNVAGADHLPVLMTFANPYGELRIHSVASRMAP